MGARLGGPGMESERPARSRTWSSGRTWSQSARLHEVQWTWVRGHRGHPKNEYANDLAVAAAREAKSSKGAIDSGFLPWLEIKQAKGKFVGYDPDVAFATLERRVAEGESFPLAEKV